VGLCITSEAALTRCALALSSKGLQIENSGHIMDEPPITANPSRGGDAKPQNPLGWLGCRRGFRVYARDLLLLFWGRLAMRGTSRADCVEEDSGMTADRHVPVYAIRAVVQLTGVPSSRIRLWEVGMEDIAP